MPEQHGERLAELRQQAREEDRHLRIPEVAEESLDVRRAAAARTRVSALPAPRRDERLQPEQDQVSRTRESQREKRGPRGDQQRREADRSGEPPDELTADD